MSDIKLPKLPSTGLSIDAECGSLKASESISVYTESQMRAYATAAIEADRKQRMEPIGEVIAFPVDGKPHTHSTLAALKEPHPVGTLVYGAPPNISTSEH